MIKKRLLLILCIVSLVACRSKNQEKDSLNKQTITKANADDAKVLITKIKPLLAGLWVNKEYIDEIKRTKSPQKSYEKVGNITDMLIDTSKIKSDTLSLYCNEGFHEVGIVKLKFDPAIFENGIKRHHRINNFDDEYCRLKLNRTRDILTLYWNEQQGKSIKPIQFYKVSIPPGQEGDPHYTIINRILISGNYLATDSLKNRFKVSFTDDGKVKGLNDFKTYQVLTDYMTPPNNLDEIGFEIDKQLNWYGFKISADTLNIYGIKEAADSVNEVLTNLKYKLVRQK